MVVLERLIEQVVVGQLGFIMLAFWLSFFSFSFHHRLHQHLQVQIPSRFTRVLSNRFSSSLVFLVWVLLLERRVIEFILVGLIIEVVLIIRFNQLRGRMGF